MFGHRSSFDFLNFVDELLRHTNGGGLPAAERIRAEIFKTHDLAHAAAGRYSDGPLGAAMYGRFPHEAVLAGSMPAISDYHSAAQIVRAENIATAARLEVQSASAHYIAQQHDAMLALEAARTRQLDALYYRPPGDQVRQLLESYGANHWASPAHHGFPVHSAAALLWAEKPDFLYGAIGAVNSPWLNVNAPDSSLRAITEIHGIGHALRNMSAYGESLTTLLRSGMGDWRDPITWTPELLSNHDARADFYAGLGFDRALTDLPPAAFEESLDNADLRSKLPPLEALYGELPSADEFIDEEGYSRNQTAHNWLMRLEISLRHFIDECMTKAHGADWPRHRLAPDIYAAWIMKRDTAIKNGRQPEPLIAYADFTDYQAIICRRDDWRNIFAMFFGHAGSVRETFQRLHPIRIDIAHSRIVTQEDELLLYVEALRLYRAIGSNTTKGN